MQKFINLQEACVEQTDSSELYGAVIINLADRLRSLEEIFSVFTAGIEFYHHCLSDM